MSRSGCFLFLFAVLGILLCLSPPAGADWGVAGVGWDVKNNTGQDANDYTIKIDPPPGAKIGKAEGRGSFPDADIQDNGDGTWDVKLSGGTVKNGDRGHIAIKLTEWDRNTPCPNKSSVHDAYWTKDGQRIVPGKNPGPGFDVPPLPGGGIQVGLTNDMDHTLWIKGIQIVINYKWDWEDLIYGNPLRPPYEFTLLSDYLELQPGESMYWNYPDIDPGTPLLLECYSGWLGGGSGELSLLELDPEATYIRYGHDKPEPGTLVLLITAGLGLGLLAWRRRLYA